MIFENEYLAFWKTNIDLYLSWYRDLCVEASWLLNIIKHLLFRNISLVHMEIWDIWDIIVNSLGATRVCLKLRDDHNHDIIDYYLITQSSGVGLSVSGIWDITTN